MFLPILLCVSFGAHCAFVANFSFLRLRFYHLIEVNVKFLLTQGKNPKEYWLGIGLALYYEILTCQVSAVDHIIQ